MAQESMAQDACEAWFKKSKLSKGTDCLLNCTILPVDLGTFSCRDGCPYFCKESSASDFLFQMSDLYPGLTKTERALVAKYPQEAISVFRSKITAESVCAKQFGDNRTNDESDACRHYIWAGLQRNSIGRDLAQKFLNAHEDQDKQPAKEKSMDLSNNRSGISASEKLAVKKIFSEDNLIREFARDLKAKKLIVLDPKAKNWELK